MRKILITNTLSSLSSSHPAVPGCAAQLFAEHQPWLLQRLSFRLRNRADAEDLTSETFLRVITRPEIDALEAPRAYLATVAKRLLINLMARYEVNKQLTIAAHLNNVLDKRYMMGVSDTRGLYGPPRNFMVSAKYRF